MEFKTQKIQFALFFNNYELKKGNIIDIVEDLKKEVNIFDADPDFLPLVDNAPLEVPRVILKSRDNNFNLSLSITRTDFFQVNINKNFKEVSPSYLDKANKISSFFIKKELIVGRIGFVVDFITEMEEESSKVLKEFFKEDYYFNKEAKNIKNVSLAFTEKEEGEAFLGKDVNKLIKIDSLKNLSDLKDNKKLQLKVDFNTSQEKKSEYNLSEAIIKDLLTKFSKKINEEELRKILKINESE